MASAIMTGATLDLTPIDAAGIGQGTGSQHQRDLGLLVPKLQRHMEVFPPDDDHVFHELMLDEVRTQVTKPAGALALRNDDFLAAFSRVPTRDGWDVMAAVNRLGL